MMTHEQKTRLGIFLTLATLIFLVVLGVFLVPKLREAGDVYYVNFKNTSVNGLLLGSSVRYQGVDIGKVTRIEVNRKDMNSVFVYIKIQRGFPIKVDTTAVLMLAGITGLRFIDLRGGSRDAVLLPPHGEIPMGRGLEEKAGDIVANIDTAVNSFNSLLSRENLDRINRFLEKAEKSSEMISQVIEAKRGKLESAFDNVEKVTNEMGSVTENLHKISTNVSNMSDRIVARSEAAVDNIAKRFSDEEMGQAIKDMRALIDTTSTSLKRIEGSLRSQQDELGRALQSLEAAMDNLARFTREISEDPTSLIRARKEKKK
jgi:phospholipid/cholesterol/gamma-HCH transport system substrate-binding protein